MQRYPLLYIQNLDSIKKKFTTIPHLCNWYRYTVNAYYDLAIANWCKLFGSYSEPTHYYHILDTINLQSKLIEIKINPPNKPKLKAKLIAYSNNLSEKEFNKYHKLTKDYRDRSLIHREHLPEEINDGDLRYPMLDIAKETFLSLTLILIELARKFSSQRDVVNYFRFIYDDLHDKEQINNLTDKSIPKFIGNTKF